MTLHVRQLFDPSSSTYTYVVSEGKDCVIIDPVREQVERDLEQMEALGLELRMILETHVHADHVTGASRLRARTGAPIAVSKAAGTTANVQLVEGDHVVFFDVIATPGHTNGCVTYVAKSANGSGAGLAFTGDALLIRGCGRTDFQSGSSRALYKSITQKLFTLPPTTTVYPAHDYKGRTVTSVEEERALNPRIRDGIDEEQFVKTMAALKLDKPKKIDEAVPANLRCGDVPDGPFTAVGLMDGEGI